ncbi:sufE-like protein 1, chloroplastic/mitochondrial [Cornus florida]|uniref:sufE-like protein 1, chloroplastic/mitochondrial n=1 Tax=Cornus florida TaxID=4283 RepID=UPI0028A1EE86|nr:sufE-like protein 1, chloroplastic/mitochondrial [Cornus florida]
MSVSVSFRLLSTKFPQSLLHPKAPIFKTLILSTPPMPTKLSFFKSISIQRIPTKPPSSSPPSSSTSVPLQPIEELPPKLQEIVKLFQAVQEPKAKYEQLLFYGRNLTPLDTQFKTSENKVQGCVSQVWVRAYHDSDKNVVFEADSDSVLTKGLAALLVQGLSGRPVEEILRVSPDFVVLLGLQQSLTPSRNNGFLNMLKLMQKKALNLYVEAEKAGGLGGESSVGSSNSSPRIDVKTGESMIGVSSEVTIDDSRSKGGDGVALGSRGERIKEKLERDLCPIELMVEDISYQHAGHAGVRGSNGETHFNVKVVSKEFEGKSLVKRHRLIYDLLQDELQSGLHALSIVAKTPHEVDNK